VVWAGTGPAQTVKAAKADKASLLRRGETLKNKLMVDEARERGEG
jgi:hypothetical protein